MKNTVNSHDVYRTCAICKKKFLRDNLYRVRLYKDKLYINDANGLGRSVYFEKKEISRLKINDFIKLIQNKLKSTLSENNKEIIKNFLEVVNEKE